MELYTLGLFSSVKALELFSPLVLLISKELDRPEQFIIRLQSYVEWLTLSFVFLCEIQKYNTFLLFSL